MHRRPWLAWILPSVALAGCQTTCDVAVLVDSVVYDTFVNLRVFDVDNRAGFPAASSPANGPIELSFRFEAPQIPGGDAVVELDGQPSDEGTAWLDARQCGWFRVDWSGTYSAEGGATHVYQASGEFAASADRLEGIVDWSEAWSDGAGEQGTLTGEAQFRGARIPGG